MLRRIILFLIRLKLGVKIDQQFQFVGQKRDARYFFTNLGVIKATPVGFENYPGIYNYSWSRVSLYWLLSDECKIRKYMGDDVWV